MAPEWAGVVLLIRADEGRRALWVVGVGEVAGVGRHVLDVARAGIPGWSLAFVVPEGPLRDALAQMGQPVMDVAFGRSVGSIRSVRAVSLAVRTARADVVHSHLAWADLVVGAARRRHAARVSTEHGIAGDPGVYATGRIDARAMRAAHRLRLRRTRGLICVSNATAEVVRRRWQPGPSTDIRIIPNGIDRQPISRKIRAPGDALVVGYLGRFSPEKRVDLLIRAFASVRNRAPRARLALAGAGDEAASLARLAADLGLGDRVSFPGWVDANAFLPEVDVLCLPSVWENCSYALLEAVSAGCGVVAAPVGGNAEILPPQCLVDPLDSDAFADTIIGQLASGPTRPTLTSAIPTVAEMTARIADAYTAWTEARTSADGG